MLSWISDETPPDLVCPTVRYVQISNDSESVTYQLSQLDFTVTDNSGVPPTLILPTIQTSYSLLDLYQTFTYTASAFDAQNNQATCRFQIHVIRK